MFVSLKSLTLLALLPAVLGATVPATTTAPKPAAPKPKATHFPHRNVALKLMPFGASIVGFVVLLRVECIELIQLISLSAGTVSCWRATLWKKLTDVGHNVDFVGTLPDSGGCPFTFDGDKYVQTPLLYPGVS